MSENVGSIDYDARISLKKLRADVDALEKELKRTGDKMGEEMERGEGRASAALQKFGKIAKTTALAAGAALVAGLTLATKASWDQVGAVEQATVGLKAYEKNGDKVNDVLKNLIGYARSDMGVLFNRKDLFDSAQALKIMGDKTENLVGHVKILSRSVGLGLSNWDDLNLIVGRVGSTGRLTGEDFDNLTKAGFKLNSNLRNTNINFEDLFKQLDKGIPVSALEGQANTIKGLGIRMQTAFRGIGDAILGVDSDTSKFVEGGLGDRLTKGLGRATITLKNFKQPIKDMSTAFLGFVDDVVPKVQHLASQVGDYLAPKFTALWNSIQDAIPSIKEFVNKVLAPMAKVLGVALVAAIGLAIDQWNVFFKIIEPVLSFLSDHEYIVWGIVGAFAAFKSAMMIKEAYGVAVDGVGRIKDAFGLLKDGIGTARDVFSKMKDVVVDSAQMVFHATKVGAAWVLEAGKASAAWLFHMGKILAGMVVRAPFMIAHAADVGLAWTINAVRASFVWVTTELPKIIAGMAKTAFWAVIHAATTSAAWIGSATKSAVVWTVTELPKIIASFAITSAQAIIHAVITSAAWVASATKSGIAWAVTTLPRIIAAFVAMSASAVLNAAIATGAWVGSAITTTQSFVALRALIATPMVMPAIVIAAAIASAIAVYNAVKAIVGAINDVNNAAKAAGANNDDQIRNLQRQAAAARATGDTAAVGRISNAIRALGYAEGGFTGLGGKYDIAGVVHRGEFVFPREAVDQSTGLPKVQSSNNVTIHLNMNGIMARSRSDLRDVAKDLIRSINEELSAKGVPAIGGGSI